MRSSLIRNGGVLAILIAGIGLSCSLWRSIFPSVPDPRPFNHAAHIERGPECGDCHEGGGAAAVGFCMECHEELDKDPKKASEKKVAWFLDEEGKPKWSQFTKQSEEILFSHKSHEKTDCLACHRGLDKDTGLIPGHVQRMSACTSCHEKEAPQKNECSTCHREIRKDRMPDDHHRLWKRRHGICARNGAATAHQCSLCHTETSCDSCHRNEEPADHNEFWRLRAHGIASGIDRSRCAVCHKTDECVRCHQETSPTSHTAGWNAPRDRHCVSCHLPVQKSGGCFVCHKSTPGHDLAPVKPAWHNPASNCRSCHAASLPHPDNGDNCNACHN